MGLYNMLFGVNPATPYLLAAMNMSFHGEKWQIEGEYYPGRFRNIFLTKNEEGEDIVILYTRNGGGNRACWELEGCPEWGAEDPSTHNERCMIYTNWNLTQHPLYIRDYDDDFDSTYAYFEFRVPTVLEEMLDQLMETQGGEPKSISEAFNEFMSEMKEGKHDDHPGVLAVTEGLKHLLEGKGGGVMEVGPDKVVVKTLKEKNEEAS